MNTRNSKPWLTVAASLGILTLPLQAAPTLVDINNPVAGQVTTNPDGSFTIVAGGNDTWDSADSFTYYYEERTGDFDVRVQVLNLEINDPSQQDSAKASLMARANISAGSPNVQVSALPTESKGAIESIYRPVADQGTDDMPDRPTGNTSASGTTPYPNVWLRMRRQGNQFTTFYGNRADQWVILSEVTVDPAQFPAKLLIGLSTVNHINDGEEATHRTKATYQNFTNTPLPPAPTVDGAPAGDRAPGVYPNATVTAVNWKLEVPANGIGPNGNPIIYNADNKNEYLLSVEGQGPIPWSAPGYNQGDLDLNLSPRDPLAALENTGPYGPKYSHSVTDPTAAPAQAWAPSPREGILLGSVRKLQQVWNDGAPAFHGFVYCPTFEGASRKGYSMLDGSFQNMDYYFSVVKLGEASTALPATASPNALREANIDIATAWFPYAQGWKAGYVNAPSNVGPGYWRAHGTHGAALTRNLTVKYAANEIIEWADTGGDPVGLATVKLPGVNALTDGLLFTISTDDSTDNRGTAITAAPTTDGSGWNVGLRTDDDDYSPTSYAAAGASDFAFLYVPLDSVNLIGGYIGKNGTAVRKAGNFTVTRVSAGRYELTLPGKTATSGMLLLQNAGYLADQPGVTDDGVLAYQFINGKFVIEARHSEADASGSDVFPTRDTDFYFAWVDFAQPFAPPGSVIAPPPSLTVTRDGANVVIAWPAETAGWTLESAATVPAATWSVVPGVANNRVTVPTEGAGSFYRLRR
jgi:hypothetical protein